MLRADLVEPDDIVVVAASGTSGAGRKPAASLLASEVAGSVSAYKAGGVHQHTPEIEQALSWAADAPARVSFTPLLAPMPRGILATCTAKLTRRADTEELREVLHEAYADEAFVHLAAAGSLARERMDGRRQRRHPRCCGGRAQRARGGGRRHRQSRQGAAGQAIQNANLMLGLAEQSGLTTQGVAP